MATDTSVEEREELDEQVSQDPRSGEAADAAEEKAARPRRRFSVPSVVRWPVTAARAVARLLMRKPVLTLSLAAVVAVLLAGCVVAATIVRHQQTATETARGAATDAARTGVTTMLSYDYHTFDKDVAAASGSLTGDFQQRYHDLMTGTVRAAALDQQTVTNASVARSSVVSATPETVDVLLFVNQTTTSKASQGPQLTGSRVQVTMTRVGDRWLISNLTPL
ncbi:twin-arginine translocation pathway signal [Amycolatopsis sp. K13G38]|uniref:Twin-arginine translocation pathway signal n=1 Tax=Amycolatopsis acididurans TaxID=2724524 RepID=A0ABX1IZ13_9PSEU|nr:twin-arginine translocation pathway signal [Amycolatopsis acididurans]NKQ51954.1 twin-arginine translocation pathway signal [Amycolatopsis acididurans]